MLVGGRDALLSLRKLKAKGIELGIVGTIEISQEAKDFTLNSDVVLLGCRITTTREVTKCLERHIGKPNTALLTVLLTSFRSTAGARGNRIS